jgi:hypothetical protein
LKDFEMNGLMGGFQNYNDMRNFNPVSLGLEATAPQNFMGGVDLRALDNNTFQMPGVTGPKTGFGGMDFSQKAGLGLQGLSSLAGLVLGLKQLSLANKQFKSTEAFGKANLANQMKSYNTALADRTRSRAWTETGSLAGVDADVEKNKLAASV